jgi:caffeoyl-CoA O-methyltransferase
MIPIDPKILNYMRDNSLRESDVLARLNAATARRPRAMMMTDPEQTQFLCLLIELMKAKRVLEVGTFTGYSTLAMASTLPADGQIVTCDIDDVAPAVGRPFWAEAGVEDKISLRLGPARDTLDGLLTEYGPGSFDLIYIDADKPGYDVYYERALKLVRTGGLIGLDNVIRRGRVADDSTQDSDTNAVRALNKKLHGDQRVTLSMLTIGDGLTLALKR